MIYTADEVLESNRLDIDMMITRREADSMLEEHGVIGADLDLFNDEVHPIMIDDITSGLIYSMVDVVQWLGY